MNRYAELKERQTKEYNEFPFMFAFDNKQFEEGMEKLGLKATDTDKIYSMGMGGYYRREEGPRLKEMIDRFDRELSDMMGQDETGEGFITEMFLYELDNHEYIVTYDVEDTLDALGFTVEEVRKDKKLNHGLKTAIGRYLKAYREEAM